jgi:hypothetical protein
MRSAMSNILVSALLADSLRADSLMTLLRGSAMV